MRLSRPLSEDGIARRNAFARDWGALLEENSGGVKWDVRWFQKNPDTMPELKSAVWEETEAISAETRVTKVVKNLFVCIKFIIIITQKKFRNIEKHL
jgi:hypothetical protein